jgi:hypothetical protein
MGGADVPRYDPRAVGRPVPVCRPKPVGAVEVEPVNRYKSRRVLVSATLSIGLILTVAAATTVTGAQSRASNRWNHDASAPAGNPLSANEAGSEPGVRGPIWKTYHLVEQFTNRFTFVDVAPKGDSAGDYGVFRDTIVTNGGVHLGTIDAQCIAAYADQCSGSIRIPGRGQITFAGITPLGVDPDHYAVTGGTGQFAGVGGVLLIEFPWLDAAKLTVYLTK